jgi:hypothetical protein
MDERLVDVLNRTGNVLHTYRITLPAESDAGDAGLYEKEALRAAAGDKLVMDSELPALSARLHISRGGQLAPYGDKMAPDSQTRAALVQAVRERAYLLWEQDGRPAEAGERYWFQARDGYLRDCSYALWEQAGRPEGGPEKFWHSAAEAIF